MVSMTKLLIGILVIQFVLVTTGLTDIPGTAIYDMVTNPTNWNNTDFLTEISILLVGVAAFGIATAGVVFKNELAVFGGAATMFLSFGMPAFVGLYNIISTHFATEIAIMFVSPLILIYVLGTLAWWRGKIT